MQTADTTDRDVIRELIESHLNRPKSTARTYAADLETFRQFSGLPTGEEAVGWLIGGGRSRAEKIQHQFVNWLREKYGALNTIRRKVQAMSGLLRLAHRMDLIAWMTSPMRLPTPERVRDMSGPPREAVVRMLEICRDRGDAKGARDEAMIALMAFAALRCDETLSLDVRHVDLVERRVSVMGKGQWGRTRHPIAMDVAEAVERWMEFRGDKAGPLLTRLARADTGRAVRLSYNGAYSVIEGLGRKVGVRCSPHRLRHFAVTEILRLTNGNVMMAAGLTRHREIGTLMHYDDARGRMAREASEMVASGIPNYRPKP